MRIRVDFTIRVQHQPDVSEIHEPSLIGIAPNNQGLMILVVEDDVSFLEQAQEILNRTRQVFLASDAERAVELARRPACTQAPAIAWRSSSGMGVC